MTPTILLPGTLCDARVFGSLPHRLAAPALLDHAPFYDAREAAAAMLDTVPEGSIGIAFSLGGWVLLEMLRLAPERFGGILLISGNAHPDAPQNAAARRMRVDVARENGFEALYAAEWPAMLGRARRNDAAIRDTIVSMARNAGHLVHGRQAETNITRPDFRDFALNPPRPIHVIAGAEDGLCARDRYVAAASGPASSLTIVEAAGHYLPLEAPEAVLAFLTAHFPEVLA